MSQTITADLTPHQRSLLGKTIPDALDAAAQAWPERLALHEIEGEQRSLTWQEFRTAVTGLRSGLESAGLGPGDKVGVIVRNQIEFPIAWLAILEAGAAIVPLNPKYTGREIGFMLGDAEATWLIGTHDLIASHAADGRIGPVTLDRTVSVGASDLAGLSYDKLLAATQTPRRTGAEPLEVTNIQFTSGTTGLPKGCLLTHEYWVEVGIYGAALDQHSVRLLADHPFYYMQNQAYLMIALFKGGALYITPGLSRRKFMNWLHDYRIDFAWIDEDILEFPDDPRDRSLSLKRAPVSGMPGAAYAPIEERFGVKARECYASTEIGSGTAVPYERDDLAGNGSMGFCFPNRESKIIDDNLDEVPPGTAGELCFRGSGMMLGYHNRPETNEQLFLPGGWFRTGDVAVKDPDGQHFFVGRLRDMIRRSDESISAAEVELHIGEMPGVEDIAAVPVPDALRGEEVKVIIVPADGARITAEQVVAWAREGLAPFKVPRYVEFRDELPYTASGKLHKAALKEEPDPLHAGVTDTRP
ncbi:class I adenylate-forming enzyme family protein [Dactylosporangium sp. CA-233914]|uniref:class I adenylate-forming enzyme family protein n=1 Tax=Dactylosporangium sp. CA-233914 TaxID=3239934 RepID=UPI003D93FDC3